MHDTGNYLWYIVYHHRPVGETAANNRATFIEQLFFDKQGFILPVKLTSTGVKGQRLK